MDFDFQELKRKVKKIEFKSSEYESKIRQRLFRAAREHDDTQNIQNSIDQMETPKISEPLEQNVLNNSDIPRSTKQLNSMHNFEHDSKNIPNISSRTRQLAHKKIDLYAKRVYPNNTMLANSKLADSDLNVLGEPKSLDELKLKCSQLIEQNCLNNLEHLLKAMNIGYSFSRILYVPALVKQNYVEAEQLDLLVDLDTVMLNLKNISYFQVLNLTKEELIKLERGAIVNMMLVS